MTTIINLYGGPGTGKSTSASYLFYLLKQKGYNAELVREYVKDWAWEDRKISPFDQFYFLGKQIRRETLLYDKVDYIVTDSPVFLNSFYANKYCSDGMKKAIAMSVDSFYNEAQNQGHKHIHIFLTRSKAYNPKGRYQTEDEAKQMDKELKDLLNNSFSFVKCNTEENALRYLLNKIIKRNNR